MCWVIGINDTSLLQSLSAAGYLNQTVEELAELTTFKLILNENRSDFPYVNIYGDSIESNYTATYKNQERSKSIEHIKALCADAKYIYIFDKHLLKNRNVISKVAELFPESAFTLFYFEEEFYRNGVMEHIEHIDQDAKRSMLNVRPKIKFKKQAVPINKRSHHDRYLIIDQKIEINLTSGFAHMFRDDDDFSYIIRELP